MTENTEFKEIEMDKEIMEKLIVLSVLWEEEENCWGYRRNTEEDLKGRRLFVAERDGEILGYLFGQNRIQEENTQVIPKDSRVFDVEELYVLPKWRSRGIGRRLFQLAEESVKNEADILDLSTATKDQARILHFYIEELGMMFWSARLVKKLH